MDDLKAFQRAGADPVRRRAADAAGHLRDRRAREGDALLRRPVDQRHADRRGPWPTASGQGFDYVGISLDGLRETHDRFRRLDGAFDRSLAARAPAPRGVKVGLRFTMTAMNAHDLPALLDLMRAEGVDKFYFSHLNYAGRGNIHRGKDAQFAATRDALDLLFERAWQAAQAGREKTTSPATTTPTAPTCCSGCSERAAAVGRAAARAPHRLGRQFVRRERGQHRQPRPCAPRHHVVAPRPGQRARAPVLAIWSDTSDPLMAGLKAQAAPGGRPLRRVPHFAICGGNTRVRAQQVTGDPWAEDPGCYLRDDEIGAQAAATPARGDAFQQAAAPSTKNACMRPACLRCRPGPSVRACLDGPRPGPGDAAVASVRPEAAPTTAASAALYGEHCAACHGDQRTGGMGPALLPESLARLRPAELLKVIQPTAAPPRRCPGFRRTCRPLKSRTDRMDLHSR
jgi:MoaA/NifB/PqqE/SkfB family radical SAM enzyme